MTVAGLNVAPQNSDCGSMPDFIHRCISREERVVITLYYAGACSMEEIGSKVNLPVGRVREIHEDVVTRSCRPMKYAFG